MKFERGNVSTVTKAMCVGAIAGLLAACSGGGSVNVGSGQTPDPATVDFPIFYVKRTIPEDQDDLRQLRDTVGNADLFKRDRAAPGAVETNITQRVTGDTDLYDIKDVDVSFDGKLVVFAMRGPLDDDQDEEDPPTWEIWEYDIVADDLHRVIRSDILASEGNDVSPHYLPDGRIVFSSTRQRSSKGVLLDEGKPGFEAQTDDRSEAAFVLHVMNKDGTSPHQISFNQSHDRDATVTSNGRLVWSRWDRAPGNDGIHLYTANPDGTDLQLLYGANSHNTGTTPTQPIQFVRPREMQNGRILTLVRQNTDSDFGGDLVIIDTNTYVENVQPTLANAGMVGPAQTRATQNDVRTVEGPSPGGRFNSAFPLWDGTNRILTTWSQCRLLNDDDNNTATPAVIVPCTDARLADPNALVAPTLYSVWMFDPGQNTLLPIMTPTEDVMITDVVAAQPRTPPPVILDQVIAPGSNQSTLVSEGVGVLSIKSVYDFDGVDTATPNLAAVRNPMTTPAANRPARFIRIEKPVSQPDDDVLDIDNAAFGVTGFMREILGYAPIEPDGSVKIKVPANVAFQLSVVDANGRRIQNSPIHSNWLQLRPGEERECNGCHQPATPANLRSHGRSGLFTAVNTGAPATGQPFPGTVATFSPDQGETMAQTRARQSCATGTPRCGDMTMSMAPVFTDVWSDPAQRTPDPAITNLSYADPSFTTLAPTTSTCITRWSSTCRIIINYTQHVQPLWDKDRPVDANGDGIPDLDGAGVAINNKCTGCHGPVNAAGMAQVPGGQLDLTAVPSDAQQLQLRSYQELFFGDNEQEVVGGALQDRLVPGPPDADGNPTMVTVGVGPYLTAGTARGGLSGAFLNRFAAGSGSNHAGYLSPAELRLLSEWLDIGAQYFNNPFDPAVPVN
jgi:hypothetical protein